MADEVKKTVLINVETDASETNKELDEVRGKLNAAVSKAAEMGRVDYGSMSVKELREELLKADQSMEQLAASGNATSAVLKTFEGRVEEINTALRGIDAKKTFDSISNGLRTATGAVGTFQGAMGLLGIENEKFEAYISRLAGLNAFRSGIEDLTPALRSLTTGMTGATGAAGALRIALSTIGIGLIVSAVAYLVEYWDELTEGFTDAFPWIEKLTGSFGGLQPVLMGVGKAVVGFVLEPIKAVISTVQSLIGGFSKLFSGDIMGGLKEIGNGIVTGITAPLTGVIGAVDNFQSGYTAAKNKVVEDSKEMGDAVENTTGRMTAATKEMVDESVKEYKRLMAYIAEADRAVSEAAEKTRKSELKDIRDKYDERIALAEKFGEDTTALLDAQRLEELAVNKKYDALNVEREKKKITDEQQARKDALAAAGINAELADDGSPESLVKIAEARRAALDYQYELDREQYKGNKEKLALIDAQYNKSAAEIDKAVAEEEVKRAEMTQQAKLDIASKGFGALSSLLGEASAAGKAAAVAQATIDTYAAAVSSYNSMSGIPIVGPALGAVAAGVAVAAGLANVKKILSTKQGSTAAPAPAQTPSLNYASAISSADSAIAPTINTRTLQRDETDDVSDLQRNNRPMRAYIVDRDLEDNAQSNDLSNRLSTF